MPKLIQTTTKKVYLPSTKDASEEEKAWVTIKDKLAGGDWLNVGIGVDNAQRTIFGLASFIVDWNFTTDGTASSEKVPITPDTVKALELEDINFLTKLMTDAGKETVDKLTTEQKKTSSSSSTPPIPGVNQ